MTKLADIPPREGLDPSIRAIAEALAFIATGLMEVHAAERPTTATMFTTAYIKTILAIYGPEVAEKIRNEIIEGQTGLSIEEVKEYADMGIKLSDVIKDEEDDDCN